MNLRPLVAFVWLAALPAAAEEVAIPAAKEPVGVQAAPRVVPQRMLVPEALRLFETLRRQLADAPAPSEAQAGPAHEGVRRVFEVELPAATRAGGTFTFEDATDRSAAATTAAPPQGLTFDQRRSAVEAFRRAVVERRAKGE